jgi:protein dithiol:quinone oxidoreductase
LYIFLLKPRNLFWLTAFGCFAAIAAALYMEHVWGLEPCPLCVFQRVAVIVAGLIALLAAIYHPVSLGRKIYGGLIVLTSVIGGAIAIRQLYLQSLPEDQVPACSPGLDYLMDVFPMTEVLQMVLTGDGSCAEVSWTFIGISIPGWTLVGFVGLIAIGGFQLLRSEREGS